MFRFFVIAALALFAATQAPAASRKAPVRIPQTFDVDFNFSTQQFCSQIYGCVSLSSVLTTTRASAQNAQWSDGHWQSFGATVVANTDLGVLSEQSSVNNLLQSRTPATTWTVSNITAVNANQTGIDNVANSAGTITATAANGTICQPRTIVSSAFTGTVFLKRLVGSGPVNISLDGGTSWSSDVSGQIGSASKPFGAGRVLMTQTLANPSFCVRIVTNGDSLAFDQAQLEALGGATSPITTTTSIVTRNSSIYLVAEPYKTLIQSNWRNFSGFVELQGRAMSWSGGKTILYMASATTPASNNITLAADSTAGIVFNVTNGNGHNVSDLSSAVVADQEIQRHVFSLGINSQSFTTTTALGTLATGGYYAPRYISTTIDTLPNLVGGDFAIGGTAAGGSQANTYIRRVAYSFTAQSPQTLQKWIIGTTPVPGPIVDNLNNLQTNQVTGGTPASLPAFGSNTHLNTAVNVKPIPTATNVSGLTGVNGKWMRVSRDWALIETSAGVYDFSLIDPVVQAAIAAGQKVLFPVLYGNTLYGMATALSPPTTGPQITAYSNYFVAVLNHYAGLGILSSMAFEMWNEPNIPTYWGGSPNVTQFTAMVNAAVAAGLVAQPTALIIGGGIAYGPISPNDANTFGAAFVGGLTTTIAGVGFHPYNTGQLGNPEQMLAETSSFSTAIGARPIWITEEGYSLDWTNYDNQRKAGWAARSPLTQMVMNPLPAVALWYDLFNDGSVLTDHESNFGLYDYNFNMLPAGTLWGAVVGLRNTATTYDVVKSTTWVYQVNFNFGGTLSTRVVWNYHMPAYNIWHTIDAGTVTNLSVTDLYGNPVSYTINGTLVTVLLTEYIGPLVITSGTSGSGCASTGIFDLSNVCNDIYFIGALR